MSLQNIIWFIVLILVTESHCVFHHLLTRLIPSAAQDEYQTKFIPLGRFRLNLANSDESNLAILPVNGKGSYVQPAVNLYLKTYQPVQQPTPRERIRTFLQGLNPFNRQLRPISTNNGFDNSYRNVVVNNLGFNQRNPITPGKINQSVAPNYYRGLPIDTGTRNNWATSTTEPGDLKILGPNFKILLNHRNQQILQDTRNARHILKSSYDTSESDLVRSFRPSSSFGMASEYVSPTYGNQLFKNAENSNTNYEDSDSHKIGLENNSNSGSQLTQDEDYSDFSSSLNLSEHPHNIPEPLTYMAPPSLQSNNNLYSFNTNYESGYSSNGPSYAMKFITNPVRDYIWSNQYDNPFNQPYPNFYRYAGWNHRADSIEPKGRKYTTTPYITPLSNEDKLMEKSDNQIDSNNEETTNDSETSSDIDMLRTEKDKKENNSNDHINNLEPLEISEEISLF